jgi:hypothetical protein
MDPNERPSINETDYIHGIWLPTLSAKLYKSPTTSIYEELKKPICPIRTPIFDDELSTDYELVDVFEVAYTRRRRLVVLTAVVILIYTATIIIAVIAALLSS